ncbi:MAG: thioesterase family protein [Candidatus Methylomirabilales bacterium]
MDGAEAEEGGLAGLNSAEEGERWKGLGMEVRAVVRLGGVNNRRLTLMFEAFDAVEKICEGIHERYIIDIEWFKRRIEQKLRKVG